VRVTAAGFSGLWQRFDLWEVAFYLNDLPRAYHLPFKFLSEYTLQDAREARLFASAAHEALQIAPLLQNSEASRKALTIAADAAMRRESDDGSQPPSYLRFYFATFTYNPQQVCEWVSRFRDARYPLRPSPVLAIPELRTKIFLNLYQDNDGDSPFEYKLKIDVKDEGVEANHGTRSVFAVSTLGKFRIDAEYNCRYDYWSSEGGNVWAGSTIDKAVKGGNPVPFVLAIRSTISGREVASWLTGNSWELEQVVPAVVDSDSETQSN